MKEFLAKAPQKEITESERVLERASGLLLDYNGPNGEIVFVQESILIDAELGLSLPKAYFAFPLRGLQNSSELSMLKEALNILDDKSEKHNPFFFLVNYDYKRDDNGIKRIFLTNEEKVELAEKLKQEAIDFTKKWSDSANRQNLFELAANRKEAIEMQKGVDEINQSIQSAYKSIYLKKSP